ncbi:MAG: hypothetical protein LBR66_02645, partial [Candidatus Symbiothrix sp.]|nr:hypothetical protein [Candidatus Symbiothrix sp.]
HSEYPEFQICSNWAFTHQQSEPVSVALDFLSGDYSPNNSVKSARFAGRYLAHRTAHNFCAYLLRKMNRGRLKKT